MDSAMRYGEHTAHYDAHLLGLLLRLPGPGAP